MRARYPEIDFIKAAAIVAVVLIHSVRPFYAAELSFWEELILRVSRFAVPAFLAVSGFLSYSATPIPLATLGRRYRRLLAPYCCVSVAAYSYGSYFPQRLVAEGFVEGLFFGATFGPYYYVFVIAELTPLVYVLSRLRARTVVMLTCAVPVASLTAKVWFGGQHAGSALGSLGFWEIRNPALWVMWLLLGWIAGHYRSQVLDLTQRYRRSLLIAWAALFTTWGVLASAIPAAAMGWVDFSLVWINIVGLFALGNATGPMPRFVWLLSDWTYAIYLLHPFFVYAVYDILAPRLHLALGPCAVAAWVSGLLGATMVAYLSCLVFGRYARDIVGA